MRHFFLFENLKKFRVSKPHAYRNNQKPKRPEKKQSQRPCSARTVNQVQHRACAEIEPARLQASRRPRQAWTLLECLALALWKKTTRSCSIRFYDRAIVRTMSLRRQAVSRRKQSCQDSSRLSTAFAPRHCVPWPRTRQCTGKLSTGIRADEATVRAGLASRMEIVRDS